jgi:hypothetical protein
MIENPTGKLKPVFDETFKFHVGDLVAVRASMAMWAQEFELNGPRDRDSYRDIGRPVQSPMLLTVVERRMTECHGGVQLQYAVSGYQDTKTGGPMSVIKFEYELMSPDDAMEIARKFKPAKEER